MSIFEDSIHICLRLSNGTVKYSVSSMFITFVLKIVGVLHVQLILMYSRFWQVKYLMVLLLWSAVYKANHIVLSVRLSVSCVVIGGGREQS